MYDVFVLVVLLVLCVVNVIGFLTIMHSIRKTW